MRGRVLFFTILLAIELAVLAVVLVLDVITGSWDLSGLPAQLGVCVVTFSLVLFELSRRHEGRISTRWVVLQIRKRIGH